MVTFHFHFRDPERQTPPLIAFQLITQAALRDGSLTLSIKRWLSASHHAVIRLCDVTLANPTCHDVLTGCPFLDAPLGFLLLMEAQVQSLPASGSLHGPCDATCVGNGLFTQPAITSDRTYDTGISQDIDV